jgi:hypothetical protein
MENSQPYNAEVTEKTGKLKMVAETGEKDS